ncbi:MAG: TadE family protein [Parasphingorhabdus sp.]
MIEFTNKSGILSRLRHSESGIALTEFALALPVFITLTVGGLEYANLASTHLRISQIAMSVADNAGRYDPSIDESDIGELIAAAEVVGDTLNFTANGRVVLSSLQHNGLSDDDEGQVINWQRCFGDLSVVSAYGVENDGETDDSFAAGMGETGNKIVAADGTAVMFVEVTYDYEPFFPGVIPASQIRYESAFNVRSRNSFDITNVNNEPINSCT